MSTYTCYMLDSHELEMLEQMANGYAFPSRRGDHITEKFGAVSADGFKPAKLVEVYGFASDNKGIEVFLVQVDGQRQRPDGGYYHMTWSLNPKAQVPVIYELDGVDADRMEPVFYRPYHANEMLRELFEGHAKFLSVQYFDKPIAVRVTPAFVDKPLKGRPIVQILANA